MTTTIKKSIAKASFKFVPPSRLGNWDKLGQAYLDKIDRAIANSRLLARYRLSTYFEKATEEVGKGLNSKREHVRLDTAHKILKGGGVYAGDIEAGELKPTAIVDNRRLIVNILTDPEARKLAIALQRAVEARASVHSGEAGAGELETGGAPGLFESQTS